MSSGIKRRVVGLNSTDFSWELGAIFSSQTSDVIQLAIWRSIPEDTTLHNHGCGNLKCYIFDKVCTAISIYFSARMVFRVQ
jgi:hypothetical protein